MMMEWKSGRELLPSDKLWQSEGHVPSLLVTFSEDWSPVLLHWPCNFLPASHWHQPDNTPNCTPHTVNVSPSSTRTSPCCSCSNESLINYSSCVCNYDKTKNIILGSNWGPGDLPAWSLFWTTFLKSSTLDKHTVTLSKTSLILKLLTNHCIWTDNLVRVGRSLSKGISSCGDGCTFLSVSTATSPWPRQLWLGCGSSRTGVHYWRPTRTFYGSSGTGDSYVDRCGTPPTRTGPGGSLTVITASCNFSYFFVSPSLALTMLVVRSLLAYRFRN